MELHQIRYFLALAKSLNFTRAAEQCEVTQPALTKAIQKLEQELGGALIFRERQLTQLTDLGKVVLPMIERTLSAADAVRRQAQEFQRRDIAPLRIALAPCISAALVTEPLVDIARVIPGLQVELIEASDEQLPDLLLDGRANAGISGGFTGLPNRIDHWRLFEERYVVLVAKDNPLSRHLPIPMQALGDAVWLERIGCPVWPGFWSANFPKSHEPKIAHRGHQESHLQHMAAANLGLLISPEHAPYPPTLRACPIAGTVAPGGATACRRGPALLACAGRFHQDRQAARLAGKFPNEYE